MQVPTLRTIWILHSHAVALLMRAQSCNGKLAIQALYYDIVAGFLCTYIETQ